jgi:hypothetical protein
MAERLPCLTQTTDSKVVEATETYHLSLSANLRPWLLEGSPFRDGEVCDRLEARPVAAQRKGSILTCQVVV